MRTNCVRSVVVFDGVRLSPAAALLASAPTGILVWSGRHAHAGASLRRLAGGR